MDTTERRRLNGLEPDNLLAFLALLGVLRALREDGKHAAVRVSWSVECPPVRPVLHFAEPETDAGLVASIIGGLGGLAAQHDFGHLRDLQVAAGDGPRLLKEAIADRRDSVWSALVSDAAVSRDGKKLEPTPLCLMFGQGHQHFLGRLASVPRLRMPPARGLGHAKTAVTEEQAIAEALFDRWRRLDATDSFRWDPREDVRYALRATNPTDSKTKETTQHGANRLAAVALPLLTVVPAASVGGRPRLAVRGGGRDRQGRFTFSWPIWQHPLGLAGVCHLLDHPHMDRAETLSALGVAEHRGATRISNGKFMNFTRGDPIRLVD